MTADTVIRAQGLGKRYVIGHRAERESYVALRDVIARNVRNLGRSAVDLFRGRPNIAGDEVEDFWALRDVSFEIKRGEVVGVIGRNGAGKSTLLKILSRITEPTEGRVEIRGRVASLLEVGTGFHPELTGRENIYLNGAILGMTHAEIRRKFDEIVAFAEVERFLDTPVKRYSSGMYVRLAFAVAAHLEPEILIVDEVLAVGDTAFQEKCIGKMNDVAVNEGRTVLFVSHNMASVERLTSRAFVLHEGRLVIDSTTSRSIEYYTRTAGGPSTGWVDVTALPRRYSGNGKARVTAVRLQEHPPSSARRALHFDVKYVADQSVSTIRASLTIFQSDGSPVGTGFSRQTRRCPSDSGLSIRVETPCLAPGRYYLSMAIGQGDHSDRRIEFDVVSECLTFDVPPPMTEVGMAAEWEHGWGPVIFAAPALSTLDE